MSATLLLEVYYTELSIHEVGLSQAPNLFTGFANQRLLCLYSCLNATKAWADVFLSIPLVEYVGLPISSFSALVHSFMGMYRLSNFEHSEWDLGLVKETLDVSLFLGEAQQRFAQVKEAAGLDQGDSGGRGVETDTFSNLAERLRVLKMSWDESHGSSITQLNDTTPNDDIGDFPMSLLDDDWLSKLLSPVSKQWV